MLQLRPICENCAVLLPAASENAMICSFECTFCRDCVIRILGNVCPNCGGGFVPRPIRPSVNRKAGNFLGNFPATEARLHAPVDEKEHRILMRALQDVPPVAR